MAIATIIQRGHNCFFVVMTTATLCVQWFHKCLKMKSVSQGNGIVLTVGSCHSF